MLNKKLPTAPTHPPSALKTIINQSRTPLSKYIHKRVTAVDRNMPYLDKLKSMLNNGGKFQSRAGYGIAHNNIYTEANTINNQMVEQTPIKKRHQRTESHMAMISDMNTSGQMKNERASPNIRLGLSQKKIDKHFLNEIKTDLMIMKKRVTSTNVPVGSNAIYGNNLARNRAKCEVVNYSKFSKVSKMGDEDMNQNICNQWGKMELGEVLGSGANASVREGNCNGSKYAVKVYEKYKLLDPKKQKRVYSEIKLLTQIPEDPNVITMHQAFENKREIHVIFQHLGSSTTLHQYFRSKMLYMEEREVQRIFGKLARGVMHLHQNGIAHRDIKPDNVLIDFDQDGEMMLKIIDFGFATANSIAELHCGTPNFMAPELLERVVKYSTFPVDIWALGVTLFYLFEGRYPFKGYDEKDLFRSIREGNYEFKKLQSPEIREIIRELLDSNPNTRITAKQLMKRDWVFNI